MLHLTKAPAKLRLRPMQRRHTGCPPLRCALCARRAITAINADKLFADEILPKNLANTVVRHEDYANGNAYLTLSATGQRLWDRSWATFRNG